MSFNTINRSSYETDTNFIQYKSNRIEFITPIERNVNVEKLRTFFDSIPYPFHNNEILDKNNIRQEIIMGSTSAIISEELIIGYLDEGDLFIILFWSDELDGWVIPNKKDEAYGVWDEKESDLSIKDANLKLLKSLDINYEKILYETVLAVCDDRLFRKREMKCTSFLSFVLIKNFSVSPEQRCISVKLDTFEQLIKGEINIKKDQYVGGILKNYQSLLNCVIKTPSYNETVKKIKVYIERIQKNPTSPFPSINPDFECPECFQPLITSKIYCQRGHTICSECADRLWKERQPCPRGKCINIEPVPNPLLDKMIKDLQ